MRTLTLRAGRRYELHVYTNDVATWRLSLTNEYGDAVDLTGKTVRCLLKQSLFDSAAAFTLTCTPVGTLTNGVVDMAITALSTAAVRDFKAEIEVETTGGAGDIESFLIFDFKVLRDVG